MRGVSCVTDDYSLPNECYTYFRITGNFDPEFITQKLGLEPDRTWKIGDSRSDGSLFDFANWELGRCAEYNVSVDAQMLTSIRPLLTKICELNEIRSAYDVSFCLQVVATVYAANTTPCLAPSMEIIDFCHATRTEIDIDLYVESDE